MKRMIYIAYADMNLSRPSGVCKKILQQAKVYSEAFDIYIIGFKGKQVVIIHNGLMEEWNGTDLRRHRRYNLYRCAYYLAEKVSAECVYIRYGYSEGAFIRLLKFLHEKRCRIVLEMATYPYKGEALTSIKGRISYIVDCLYRNKLKKYIHRIVTFSEDRSIYGIPCIHTMNGIIVEEMTPNHPQAEQKEEIELLAVSSMQPWHGYDRLIEGLHEYYETHPNGRVIKFHLVGDGPEMARYRQLASQYELTDCVQFHGFLTGDSLDKVYDQADIGVASLALHRIGVSLASTLKTREYAAKGLPIITSSRIDIFPPDYPYMLLLAADEKPIDIQRVVEFFLNISQHSRIETIDRIRAFAAKHCDLNVLLRPVVEYFNAAGEA